MAGKLKLCQVKISIQCNFYGRGGLFLAAVKKIRYGSNKVCCTQLMHFCELLCLHFHAKKVDTKL